MALNDQEKAFMQRVRANARALSTAIDEAQELERIYFARGYNSGGSDELLDADIQAETAYEDLSATEVGDYITAAQQAVNYRDNSAVTQADYGATLRKVEAL